VPAVSLDEYLANIHNVQGWLNNSTAVLSHALMRHQTEIGITGNACEIGVHHGRYFIALALGLTGPELGVAIDLFQAQDQNLDHSGKGDRTAFDRNVARFLDPQRIVAIQGNSLDMSPAEILAHGPVRFFSVDGRHTSSATLNDLRLAEASLAPGGIVAADDLFNPSWTGVISGVADYLKASPGLRPFALVPNKLLFCRPEDVARYRSFLRTAFPKVIHKTDAEFMGSAIEICSEIPEWRPQNAAPGQTSQQVTDIRQMRKELTGKDTEIARLKSEIAAIKASRRYRLGSALARWARFGR
jgi:hypothetical protein